MRVIDADALTKTLIPLWNCHDDSEFANKDIWQAIEKAPTIEPEPQWIPCDETVEIPDHEILACDKYGEEMFGYLAYEDEQWLCESDGCMMYDPIAWREKPEPWRGEDNERA